MSTPLPAKLVLPKSISKAAGLCLSVGLITGWAYFLVVGSSIISPSPIGTMWVLLCLIPVGLFASLASVWAVVAFVNRRNRMICFLSLSIVVMLVLALISFFAADLSS